MRLLRYAWASPCTLVGLLLVAPALLAGMATARVVEGAIEVALEAASWRTRRLLPFNAITFGHLVFGVSRAALERLRRHEQAHVRQYEQWGPLFFLAYPAASAWEWLRGRRAYRDNWFEVQARACDARHEEATRMPESR
jgi:hypothetical protein